MKLTTKLIGGVGAVIITMAAAGTVAFAATSNGAQQGPTTTNTVSSSSKLSGTLKAGLKADRAAAIQLEATNKQLNAQIKADLQNWRANNPNPLKQLSSDQQTQVKTLWSDIKSLHGDLQSTKGQLTPLLSQLKTAKANKESAAVAALKPQITPLLAKAKSDRQQIQSDVEQIRALLPAGSVQAFRQKQATLHSALGSDYKAIKASQQQLKQEFQTLKTDRANKAWGAVDQDLQQLNRDLNTIISEKQGLLQNFPK